MNPPRVFISYSHDSALHKNWVLQFATTLRNRGVDAVLDQWDLKPGGDLPHFMETQLENCDYALLVCTETYVQKANEGAGGVGYEKMIMTSSMLLRIEDNKCIPIIRDNPKKTTPTFLKTKVYIDFSNDNDVEYSFDDLLRTLFDAPLYKKPEIGGNPFVPIEEARPDRTSDGIFSMMETVAKAYEASSQKYITLSNIIQSTNMHRLTLDKYLHEAINAGLIVEHDTFTDYFCLTEEGRNYIFSHNIVAD